MANNIDDLTGMYHDIHFNEFINLAHPTEEARFVEIWIEASLNLRPEDTKVKVLPI